VSAAEGFPLEFKAASRPTSGVELPPKTVFATAVNLTRVLDLSQRAPAHQLSRTGSAVESSQRPRPCLLWIGAV